MITIDCFILLLLWHVDGDRSNSSSSASGSIHKAPFADCCLHIDSVQINDVVRTLIENAVGENYRYTF